MYSYHDFERLFVCYKLEGVPSSVSIEKFCLSNQVRCTDYPVWTQTQHIIVSQHNSKHYHYAAQNLYRI